MLKNMESELEGMVSVYGVDKTTEIYNKALEHSDSLMFDSGFIHYVEKLLLPKEYIEHQAVEDRVIFDTKFWSAVSNAINNIPINTQYILLRIYGLVPWVFMAIVVITASLLSGYLTREVKKQGFEYSSPLRHGLARRLIYAVPLGLLLFFLVPLSLPIYLVPCGVIILAVSINLLIANTIKRV